MAIVRHDLARLEGGAIRLWLEYESTNRVIERFVCENDTAGQPRLTVIDGGRTILDQVQFPPGSFSRALPGNVKMVDDGLDGLEPPFEPRFSA